MHATMPPPLNRRKRVLVIQYSQTGQMTAVAERLVAPLREDPAIELHVETLRPLPAYPFPWPFFRFLDVFPESALLQPPALAPLTLNGDEHFDLVILPYQVWFLAPSPPITAFLRHPVARRLLRGRPVVTVIACRNMWMLAQEKLKDLLAECGARLIDNVVLIDPGPTLATFFTTPRWLWTGNKAGFWGMPPAGLNAVQIKGTRRFGLALRDALRHSAEQGTQPLLAGLGAVTSLHQRKGGHAQLLRLGQAASRGRRAGQPAAGAAAGALRHVPDPDDRHGRTHQPVAASPAASAARGLAG